jgi:hypothetical protein
MNIGTGFVIFTLTTSTVLGVLKMIVPPGASFGLVSDGTNYVLTGVDISGIAGGLSSFWGGGGDDTSASAGGGGVAWNGATAGGGATHINVAATPLRSAQLCGKCTLQNSGTVASSLLFAGIYGTDGNLILDVAGATGFSGSSAAVQTKSFTQFLLLPGTYFVAYGIGTNGTNVNTAAVSIGLLGSAFFNVNAVRCAKTANVWSASTGLPATLGALTAIGTASMGGIFFEP